MKKAFRNKQQTIYCENFVCSIIYTDKIELIFSDKKIQIYGLKNYEDLEEYCRDFDKDIFDLSGEIKAVYDVDNILYNILNFMKEYGISSKDMMLSYGASMVYHGFMDETNDIDIMITPELSFKLEDMYNIRRYPAPLGNTSKQIVGNIDLFAFDGTDARIGEKFDIGGVKIKIETPESLVTTYLRQGRDKDYDKVNILKKYL